MALGLRVVGRGATGRPCPETGFWIKAFDPDFANVIGKVEYTTKKNEIKAFATIDEAKAFVMQTSKVKPTRHDGKPNRPLTAFTLEILDIETGRPPKI